MNIDSDKLLEWISKRRPQPARSGCELARETLLQELWGAIHSGELAAKRVYARAPEDCPSHFTPGKEYELLFETDDEHIFFVKDDEGDELSCDWTGNIQGSSPWELVEK